jgi:large subunit ribosomal protein L5
MSEEMSETAQQTEQAARPPRLRELFAREVAPRLMERFGLENPMAVPRLEKIVINIGVGEAVQDQSALNDAVETLRAITGQQPVVTRARRSVAGFHLRQGVPVGCKVTLRRRRMWEFLDRLISIVLPRVRDFRGLPADSFDGSGNYTLGVREVAVFPEMDLDAVKNVFGLDVSIVTTAGTDQEGFELLNALGMPFKQ